LAADVVVNDGVFVAAAVAVDVVLAVAVAAFWFDGGRMLNIIVGLSLEAVRGTPTAVRSNCDCECDCMKGGRVLAAVVGEWDRE
jgi:hypothetical protein